MSTISPRTTCTSTVDLDQAGDMLLNHDPAIVPATFHSEAAADLAIIVATASALGLTTTEDLVGHQEQVLEAITGQKISAPTTAANAPATEELHRYRNILTAAMVCAARSTRQISQALEGTTVGVARTHLQRRALTDDEIVLMRTYAMAQSHVNGAHGVRSAVIYALCESGVNPQEVSSIRLADLDVRAKPQQVRAPGDHKTISARALTLDPFARAVTARGRDVIRSQGRGSDELLAYKPRKHDSGSLSAYTSVHVSINYSLNKTKLKHPDLTASAVGSWRQQRAYLEGKDDALRSLCGQHDVEPIKRRIFEARELRDERASRRVSSASDLIGDAISTFVL